MSPASNTFAWSFYPGNALLCPRQSEAAKSFCSFRPGLRLKHGEIYDRPPGDHLWLCELLAHEEAESHADICDFRPVPCLGLRRDLCSWERIRGATRFRHPWGPLPQVPSKPMDVKQRWTQQIATPGSWSSATKSASQAIVLSDVTIKDHITEPCCAPKQQ